jgi:hypothetical protein
MREWYDVGIKNQEMERDTVANLVDQKWIVVEMKIFGIFGSS